MNTDTLQDHPEFQALAVKVVEIAVGLEHNTAATNEINTKVDALSQDAKAVVAAFNSAKGAFEVLEWTGKVSKVLLPVFLAFGSMVYASEWLWVKIKLFFGMP